MVIKEELSEVIDDELNYRFDPFATNNYFQSAAAERSAVVFY